MLRYLLQIGHRSKKMVKVSGLSKKFIASSSWSGNFKGFIHNATYSTVRNLKYYSLLWHSNSAVELFSLEQISSGGREFEPSLFHNYFLFFWCQFVNDGKQFEKHNGHFEMGEKHNGWVPTWISISQSKSPNFAILIYIQDNLTFEIKKHRIFSNVLLPIKSLFLFTSTRF